MKHTTIHKEGYCILPCIFFILLALNWAAIYFNFPIVIIAILLAWSVFTFTICVRFFRSPYRKIEIDNPNLIVAPADGLIVAVEPTDELEHFGDKRMQVSIFMSAYNVHVNWYPIAGKVIKYVYHKGKYMAANLPKSSTENERSTIVIETPSKTQILLRQIAGLLARRIVTYAKEGTECNLNEELGFIKFGSRVDLFLPLDTEIYVKVGEKTTGNKTIIGKLNP